MYMTFIGIGGMAIIMFSFMRKMYTNKTKNTAIIIETSYYDNACRNKI
jgi:formate-dependent nitrite reductase membrane component NrfD